MLTERTILDADAAWQETGDPLDADLVLYFGPRSTLEQEPIYPALRHRYPRAMIVGCSTGGQIVGDDVSDDLTTAIAARFEGTQLDLAVEKLGDHADAIACGRAIGKRLARPDLAGVFVLGDGMRVNGSDLIAGIASMIDGNVPFAGGLAGDGTTFLRTLVGANGPPRPELAEAIGFYGPRIEMRVGTGGGWDGFGPRRQITGAVDNVLYRLDDEAALDLYERYLGDEINGLPGTALLFPLRIIDPEQPGHDMIRTVLRIDREARSMIFGGNIRQGWSAQLMRGRFDRLASASAEAARQARGPVAASRGGLAIVVSCIGRRILMRQHVPLEIEAVVQELGAQMPSIGFYSYGEIAPHAVSGVAQLHNQTMAVTMISETG